MNIFDGLAKLLKPNPKNVAERQETKRARIAAQQAIKEANIESGSKASWDAYWQSALDAGHATLDPLSAGGAFSTKEGGFGREVYEQTHDSAHAVGSGVLSKLYGVDANYEQSPYEMEHYGVTGNTAPTVSAPATDSGGIPTAALVVGGLAIVALAMSARK